ncbi:MAG TPA: hypothetical protein VHC50_10455 [Puia sp.]|nr:hypothetical protein [Puia sp.]
MKKISLSIAIMLMIGLGAFAAKNDETDVSNEVVRSFHREFINAKNVKWEKKAGYVKVEFTLNDQVLFAYYNNDGQMTAIVRNIVSDQLPISLLTSVRNDYSGYWISDLFEVAADGQTNYYVTLENADRKMVLRSSGIEGWEVYSRTKKTAE